MFKKTTNNTEQTIAFGKRLSVVLKPNTVIALSGDLGSGKTTLVKGIAQGLEIDPRQVNSPSFVLIKEYSGKKIPLFHCDLYRLEGIEQIAFLGLDDYFTQKGIFVIEWAKKAQDLLPDEYLDVNIKFVSRKRREFALSAKGKSYKEILNKLKQDI